MPTTSRRRVNHRPPKTTRELAKELTAMKAQIDRLRKQWSKTNQTLLHLCCPQKWFEEKIDADELWSEAISDPPLDKVIDGLR